MAFDEMFVKPKILERPLSGLLLISKNRASAESQKNYLSRALTGGKVAGLTKF